MALYRATFRIAADYGREAEHGLAFVEAESGEDAEARFFEGLRVVFRYAHSKVCIDAIASEHDLLADYGGEAYDGAHLFAIGGGENAEDPPLLLLGGPERKRVHAAYALRCAAVRQPLST